MNIQEELKKAEEIVNRVRDTLGTIVEEGLQKPIDGVTELSDKPRCFSVRFSDIIRSKDLCLAPSFYDSREQRDAILSLIKNEDPMYAISTLQELCNTGKSASKYFKDVRFNPQVLEKLDAILKEVA